MRRVIAVPLMLLALSQPSTPDDSVRNSATKPRRSPTRRREEPIQFVVQQFTPVPAIASSLPGDILPGAVAQEFELFRLGLKTSPAWRRHRRDWVLRSTEPVVRCATVSPAVGGVTAMTEIRAGYRDEAGRFRELSGGTLYICFQLRPHTCQVQIPPQANVVSRRAPIPLFGAV